MDKIKFLSSKQTNTRKVLTLEGIFRKSGRERERERERANDYCNQMLLRTKHESNKPEQEHQRSQD